jgi:hypothetical protein
VAGVSGAAPPLMAVRRARELLLVGATDTSATTQAEDIKRFELRAHFECFQNG